MSVQFPQTITRLRAPLVSDGKGNMIRDWPNAVSVALAGFIPPVGSDEQNVNQDRVVSRWRVFVERGADVVPTDRIAYAGITYQVDGEIQAWPDLAGIEHHREGFLKRVIGG